MLLRPLALVSCTTLLLVGQAAGSATAAYAPARPSAAGSTAFSFAVPVTALVRRDASGAVVAVMTNDGRAPDAGHEVWDVTRRPAHKLPAAALDGFTPTPEDLPWRTGSWVRARR